MDDNWGNIIYLILMALFVAVGALKKKKPPVPVSPPDDGEVFEQEITQTQAAPKSGFDTVLEALLGGEITQEYTQPVEEPTVEKEVIVKNERNYKKESIEYTDRKRSAFDDLKSTYAEEEVVEEEEVEQEEVDWRQAIIYKEILDRKYN